MNLKKFIGNKSFYKMLMVVALPIMAQQGISSFVNLLDNLMVGSLGTEQMSGVAITNQLLFVYNLSIFGILSGAAIFSSQFFGANDLNGVKSCFRYKIYVTLFIVLIAVAILINFNEPLIRLFLHNEGENVGDIELAFEYSQQYLKIMLFGLLPFAISQIYSTTLRETKDTIIPMISSFIAIFINLMLNYILIFGHFGFEAMGIKGAAIATVLSRFVEMGFLMIYTHTHTIKYQFIQGVYKSLTIPAHIVLRVTRKGLPLFLNELLWSVGMTTLFKIYSERGFMVIAAFNISSTANNLFMISFIALANAIAIIIGQLLGAGKLEEAKDSSRKILFFTVVFSMIIGIVFIISSFFIPNLYKTSESVKSLATSFMIVAGLCFPIYAFNTGCYFNLRAGGVSFVTFLFDSVFVIVCCIPVAFLLVRYTDLSILYVYLSVQLLDFVKSFIGFLLVKNGVWIKNLVHSNEQNLELQN